MLAQLINFAIVVGVLWWFALKPLVKMMRERSHEIEAGLKNAEEAEQRLVQAEKEVQEIIRQSRKQAEDILSQAKKQAEENKRLLIEKTKQEADKVLEKTKQQIEQERQKMMDEAKKELGAIVIKAVEKALSDKLTQNIDQAYIKKVLKDIANEK